MFACWLTWHTTNKEKSYSGYRPLLALIDAQFQFWALSPMTSLCFAVTELPIMAGGSSAHDYQPVCSRSNTDSRAWFALTLSQLCFVFSVSVKQKMSTGPTLTWHATKNSSCSIGLRLNLLVRTKGGKKQDNQQKKKERELETNQ